MRVQIDDYFAAVEERMLSGYMAVKAGVDIKPVADPFADDRARYGNSNRHRMSGRNRCPVCGDVIDIRAKACRRHYATLRRRDGHS